jgi:hypothetical protein
VAGFLARAPKADQRILIDVKARVVDLGLLDRLGHQFGKTAAMRILEKRDVVALLRSEVKKAGGVIAWSNKTGVHRTTVSKVIGNHGPPTKSIIRALKLRTVFADESA